MFQFHVFCPSFVGQVARIKRDDDDDDDDDKRIIPRWRSAAPLKTD